MIDDGFTEIQIKVNHSQLTLSTFTQNENNPDVHGAISKCLQNYEKTVY